MNLMVITFLILHPQVLTLDYLYSELEHFEGSCFPRDSCEPPRSPDDDHLWGNFTCECGQHCVRYGKCCANSQHAGKMLHTEDRGETCQRLTPFFPQSVMMTSKCSDRWRSGFHIRSKCEKPDNSTVDPMSVVPVTSLSTFVSYKNYFCAMCNHDSREISFWDIMLQFEIKESVPGLANITRDYLLENIFYNNDIRAWGIVANDSYFYKVKFKYKVPPSIKKFVKKCYSNMVTRCGPSFSHDYKLQYKCLSYYAPIRLREKGKRHLRKFRNIHCAICNGVNATDSDFDICELEAVDRRMKPSFSFAHLIDINTADGDVVGKRRMCADRQLWDPFSKKCRSLTCAVPGYIVKDGKCVQS